jgi:polyphosphate:AMP phosphotransferase
MFETAELGRSIAKRTYRAAVPRLRAELLRVQNELRVAEDFSVIVVVNGVDGAGKGETVNILHEWMDPRYLAAHAFAPPTDEERERFPMWRFWRVLPPRGRIGIFFGSWYSEPILRMAYGRTSDHEFAAALGHINTFEKTLADDGTLLLKYWFHLGKKAQRKRLKALSRDPKQRWRVTKTDWKHFKRYDDFIQVSAGALRETSTAEAPWTVVEGTDANYRDVTVGRHLLRSIIRHTEKATRARRTRRKPPSPGATKSGALGPRQPTILSTLDLTRTLRRKDYKRHMLDRSGALNLLSRKLEKAGLSAILVFEGADAAGKGGAIRRVTRAIDARRYTVVPIAAPNDEERARHYLWRFSRHLPRAGHMTIFDRSWYGRVLVERVEGFAREDEWRRAYTEISEFEQLMSDHGMAIVKFWLQIDKDEQLRRFREREKTPYKKYKITKEDYRNRSRWALYEDAVDEMVARTSSTFAPWTLVEANDKYHARMKVMDATIATLEGALARAKRGRRKRT